MFVAAEEAVEAGEAVEAEERVESLQGRAAELCGLLHATTAELVAVVAEALVTEAWAQPGVKSPVHWLTWQCGLSASRAHGMVAMATCLAELPVARAAFGAGALSEDQVRLICAHVPAHHDADVVELARGTTVPQLARVLSSYPFLDDDDKEPEDERREASFGHRRGRGFALRARVPDDQGAVVAKALEEARAELFAEASAEDRASITWADALLRVAERFLGAQQAGASSAERYQVLLHIRTDSPGREAHLHLGPALSADQRRLLSCGASLRHVLEDEGGTAGSYGRLQRSVSAAVRRIVEDRDRGCRVPGCGQSRWVHLHHLVHWDDGGPSEPANLALLCPAHHRLHHRGRLDITGDPDQPGGLTFSDPRTGAVLDACGHPRPPDRPVVEAGDALGVQGTFVHAYGERLDRSFVVFRPNRPEPSDASRN